MDQRKWNVGDLVMLKSGGPTMTVIESGAIDQDCECSYVDGRGSLEEVTLPHAALVEAPTDREMGDETLDPVVRVAIALERMVSLMQEHAKAP